MTSRQRLGPAGSTPLQVGSHIQQAGEQYRSVVTVRMPLCLLVHPSWVLSCTWTARHRAWFVAWHLIHLCGAS